MTIHKPKRGHNIRTSRKRTNFLKEIEFTALEYLCALIPEWVTSNQLTFLGVVGGAIVTVSCILASWGSSYYLLLGILGFFINWLGDSLDGRLAYYRNIPRKWFGWSLDLNADLLAMTFIALGFYFYLTTYKVIAIIFILVYFWLMIVSLLRYKITDEHLIDSHSIGPTELRIVFCICLILEIFIPGTILILGFVGVTLMTLFGLLDAYEVIQQGDALDKSEKIKNNRSSD